MADYLQVFCTVPTMKEAGFIAETVVEQKLAACCNIIPNIRSVYSWKGEVVKENEILLHIKTHFLKYAALEKKIIELHPYEVPEIIATEIKAANLEYLKWINKSVEV